MDIRMMILVVFLSLCWYSAQAQLKFNPQKGEFRIVQVADMHYANGKTTPCRDIYPNQMPWCSDLNTTAFLNRVIAAEKPDLVVFTGDNIYQWDSSDAIASLDNGFGPAVDSLPWAAVLGNHDQEGPVSREGVMKHIAGMKNTVSQLNPPDDDNIDGFGNYNVEVHGIEGTDFEKKSVLNLYFVDSGDYSTVPSIPGYGWIKRSQEVWFTRTSAQLKKAYQAPPAPQKTAAPGLVFFHIPLPEYAELGPADRVGVKGDPISSASINSGFFDTLEKAGDVKGVFVGHDHLNDFCGNLRNINLCYAGGFGYHAYGLAGWPRRTRVISISLEKTEDGSYGGVESIKTWKRLDDETFTTIDEQVLWSKDN